MAYSDTVHQLIDEIYQIEDKCPEFEMTRYNSYLEKNGIEWNSESMTKADVSKLDEYAIHALLVATVCAERFCDGIVLEFLKTGSILRWLERLDELSRE